MPHLSTPRNLMMRIRCVSVRSEYTSRVRRLQSLALFLVEVLWGETREGGSHAAAGEVLDAVDIVGRGELMDGG